MLQVNMAPARSRKQKGTSHVQALISSSLYESAQTMRTNQNCQERNRNDTHITLMDMNAR